eukprot:s1703_g2.t1
MNLGLTFLDGSCYEGTCRAVTFSLKFGLGRLLCHRLTRRRCTQLGGAAGATASPNLVYIVHGCEGPIFTSQSRWQDLLCL